MTARVFKKIDWEPVLQDLDQMQATIWRASFPASVWRGSGEAVIKAIRRLSNYDAPEIVIAMAMATGAGYQTALASLARLELPRKTALLVALDSEGTITDRAWLAGLREGLQEISHRFAYAEIVFTSNRPIEYLYHPALYSIFKDEGEKIQAKMQEIGIRSNVNPGFWPWAVREQIRIILKHSDCRYVFWLDADVRPPEDTLRRLLELTEKQGADLAAGWYMDRHLDNEPACNPAVQFVPETAEEEKDYEAMQARWRGLYNLSAGNSNESFEEWYKGHYPVAPSKLRRSKEPIELGCTGFGCTLLKKELNNGISFVDFDGGVTSEVLTVCRAARKKGYKLLLDPTCYCEHAG